MRILLSAFFLLSSANALSACRFKTHAQKIYSLSGVTTVALKEMGLLKSPAIKGISVFNPIAKEDFQGTRYPGGIFLSHKSFAEFGGSIVFYDESRELAKVLDPMSSIQGVQIKTRGMLPVEVSTYVVKELMPFLEGCEGEVASFIAKTKSQADHLLKNTPVGRSAVYYLGAFKHSRPPELLMVHDGVVKWLILEKKLSTYPSTLAYVNWSAKVMQSMPKKTLHIAVTDSGAEMTKKLEKKGNHWELVYPGALVPGLTQLEAWNYFEEMASP